MEIFIFTFILFKKLTDFNQQTNNAITANTAQFQLHGVETVTSKANQTVNLINRNQQPLQKQATQQQVQQINQINQSNQQRLQQTKILAAKNAFGTQQRNFSKWNFFKFKFR